MRCPLCEGPLRRWRLLSSPSPARPLCCDHCGACLALGPRTRAAALVDSIVGVAIFFMALRVLEAPSWQAVLGLAALTSAGVWLDVRFATLEPAQEPCRASERP